MPNSSLSVVVQQLRAAVDGRADEDLLTHFLDRRDEDALAALVERHAAMVWGVCRRVLRQPHDAEDAFQATFLVLVQKAAMVVPREMVANWLYGVAQQTAVRLRAAVAKRGWREMQMDAMPEPTVAEARDEELLSRLDEELSRLPERFRALIVLCDLEGHTRKEVARQLGCPEGTVASGLARARELLAKRLTRHGLAVSGGLVVAALSHSIASADVPATVVTSTIKVATLLAIGKGTGVISGAVATLTQGVPKTMFLKKLVAMAVLALGAAVIVGGSLAVGQTERKPMIGKGMRVFVAEKPVANATPDKEARPQASEKANNDMPKTLTDKELLQGTWHVVALENGGKKIPVDAIQLFKLWVVIKGNKMFETTMTPDGRDVPEKEWIFVLDEKTSPKLIDATRGEDKQIGIYGFEDGKLKVCMDQTGKNRPTSFKTEKGTAQRSLILQKEEAFTAWGKEVGGVQAGLGYLSGQKRTYNTGETVTVVLRVRNVGKEAVKFSYYHEEFWGSPPAVTDDGGKPVSLEGVQLLGWAKRIEVTLAPGKEVDLSEASLVLRPVGEKGKAMPVWKLFGTGKFQLQCDQAGGQIQDEKIGPDPILSKLATGKLELEVKEPEKDGTTAWGKEVNGVQVGIRLGKHRVYQVGETVTLTLRLRNNGKEHVPFRDDAEYFHKNPPLITDANGKTVAIRERSIFGFIRERSVAPRKEVDLIQLELALQPAKEREKNAAWTLYGTGKFQIQYSVADVVGEVQVGSPGLTLTTGTLELEVTEKKPMDIPVKPL